jgi:hypothetical protein
VYNATLLAQLRQLVDDLDSYGIATILDAHQDSLSRYYCGEGAPDWYIHPNATAPLVFPFPIPASLPPGPDGYPNITACQQLNFALYLFSVAEQASWGAAYNATANPAFTAGFAGMWGAVASVMNGSRGLLAYELLNEPQPGDLYAGEHAWPGKGRGGGVGGWSVRRCRGMRASRGWGPAHCRSRGAVTGSTGPEGVGSHDAGASGYLYWPLPHLAPACTRPVRSLTSFPPPPRQIRCPSWCRAAGTR